MKYLKQLSLLSMLFISVCCFSQNVGIGVTTPAQALSIDRGVNIDNNNQNPGSSLLNVLRFANTATAN